MRVTTNDFQSRLSACFDEIANGGRMEICLQGKDTPSAMLRAYEKSDIARSGVTVMPINNIATHDLTGMVRDAVWSGHRIIFKDDNGSFATLAKYEPAIAEPA